MTPQKPILIYIFDPLCGWCYGFSPVIRQLHAELGGQFHFEVWSGGMVTGDRVQPMSVMKDYILQAIPRLEATTGVVVGTPFRERLIDGTTISNSEPPSRAFTLLKQAAPDRQVYWGSAIQQVIYVEGKDANLPETYFALASEAGMEEQDFLSRWNDPATAAATQAEFEQVAKIGVRGFPSLLLYHNEQLMQVAYGYRTFESLYGMLSNPEALPVR